MKNEDIPGGVPAPQVSAEHREQAKLEIAATWDRMGMTNEDQMAPVDSVTAALYAVRALAAAGWRPAPAPVEETSADTTAQPDRCEAQIWPSWAPRYVQCGSPVRNGRCAMYGHEANRLIATRGPQEGQPVDETTRQQAVVASDESFEVRADGSATWDGTVGGWAKATAAAEQVRSELEDARWGGAKLLKIAEEFRKQRDEARAEIEALRENVQWWVKRAKEAASRVENGQALADKLAQEAHDMCLVGGESPRPEDFSEGHYVGVMKTKREIAAKLAEALSGATPAPQAQTGLGRPVKKIDPHAATIPAEMFEPDTEDWTDEDFVGPQVTDPAVWQRVPPRRVIKDGLPPVMVDPSDCDAPTEPASELGSTDDAPTVPKLVQHRVSGGIAVVLKQYGEGRWLVDAGDGEQYAEAPDWEPWSPDQRTVAAQDAVWLNSTPWDSPVSSDERFVLLAGQHTGCTYEQATALLSALRAPAPQAEGER